MYTTAAMRWTTPTAQTTQTKTHPTTDDDDDDDDDDDNDDDDDDAAEMDQSIAPNM